MTAPTNGYSATVTDANGVDELAGQASGLSSTVSQIFSASLNPPLAGVLTLNITGNSVASATGTAVGYLVPPEMARSGTPQPACNTAQGVYCVGGSSGYPTIAAAYAAINTAQIRTGVIVDNNLSYTNPEVMYCLPWVNDGTENGTSTPFTPVVQLYLGPGILQFNNTTASGAACAANQETFGPARMMTINGSGSGPGSTNLGGTIIQAGALWNSSQATYYPTNSNGLMPLVEIGDITGSTYVSSSQLNNVSVDCASIPGCVGIEMHNSQEQSGVFNVAVKNATIALFWHGSNAQNSSLTEFYDTGCSTPAQCPLDSTYPKIEIDNAPSLRGWFGGTVNAGNNSLPLGTGSGGQAFTTVESGAGPYTETVTLGQTLSLSNPSAPTVTATGGTGTTWEYEVVGMQTFTKTTAASSAGSVSGPATLSTTAYNTVAGQTITGAYWCKIYRSANSGSTWAFIFELPCTSNFKDIGYAASGTDTTPAASNTTGLLTTDFVGWIKGTNGTTGTWPVASVTNGTTFTFTSASSLGSCASACGTISIMPGVGVGFCDGTTSACIDHATGNPTMLPIYNVHFEHMGYGLEPLAGTTLVLTANGLNTVSGSANNDVYEMVYVPNLPLAGLVLAGLQGSATNSLYTDLYTGVTIPTATKAGSLYTYNINGGGAAVAAFLAVPSGANFNAMIQAGGVPLAQNSQSGAYTTVLSDGGGEILHPTADNNARTFTIAANSSVAYPVGTVITFVNQVNTLTIAINSDTLQLAGTATTGSRTLAAGGIATATKVTSTLWFISGPGLT